MNTAKKYQWKKFAENHDAIEWQDNSMCIIEVAGKKFTLAKVKDKLYAFAQKCPHAGGIMANGHLDAVGNIVCPLHRYKFNIENGRNISGEGYYLKTYPIEQRNEGIYIGMEDKGLFNWI
jgi:3-phenylpropionate/trans-cinnamate dioxygenase ferredoxin subunit